MSTNRPGPRRTAAVLGALTSAATVALIGVGALSAETARGAGVATGLRTVTASVALTDPASPTTAAGTSSRTYRLVRGQLVPG